MVDLVDDRASASGVIPIAYWKLSWCRAALLEEGDGARAVAGQLGDQPVAVGRVDAQLVRRVLACEPGIDPATDTAVSGTPAAWLDAVIEIFPGLPMICYILKPKQASTVGFMACFAF